MQNIPDAQFFEINGKIFITFTGMWISLKGIKYKV